MGGMQTRSITLANLDKFSHIGIFSGGSISPAEITDMDAFKQQVKVVFVSYGSREKVLPARPASKRCGKPASTASSTNPPIPLTSGSPGGAALHEFAPLLFKN